MQDRQNCLPAGRCYSPLSPEKIFPHNQKMFSKRPHQDTVIGRLIDQPSN